MLGDATCLGPMRVVKRNSECGKGPDSERDWMWYEWMIDCSPMSL